MNIFEKAAEILMEGGHCKGVLRKGAAHCAIGSLMSARSKLSGYDNGDVFEASTLAADRLIDRGFTPTGKVQEEGLAKGMDLHPLAEWNDRPETSPEDVILLFKELGAEAAGE